jgi:nitrogen fixation negative regulator NifL
MENHQMSNPSSPYYALDNLTETLKTFLAAPPADMPANVITELAQAVLPGGGLLPPRLFYEAVEQSSFAISITDLKANILYVNSAFEHVTGYNRSEIIGQNKSILSDKSTPSLVYETLWGRLLQQKPWTGLLLNRRQDGEGYLAEVNITPVLNAEGKTTYYLAMHRDVTELHRLEQQVKNQKALIESVVDAAPVVIALFDENGQLILGNQKYQRLIKELHGHQSNNIFLKTIQEMMGEQWMHLHAKKGSFNDQEVRITPGGYHHPRWFVCSGTWFQERDGSADAFFEVRQQSYLLLVANEVTLLKRQQEELRMNALRALLAEEELTEGMRETLAGAIHQLQGPMNLISAALEMLKRRAQSQRNGDDHYHYLCQTLQETLAVSNQALENLHQGLPLAENQEEIASPINLNELLKDVLIIFTHRLLTQGIVVDWKPALMLPSLLGHISRLRGMFKQLIDNAIDAMKNNRHERELRITTAHDEEMITVTIEDTGSGIPAQWRFKVFEPFFTTKKAERRTGMGLAAVQETVNLHAGTIHIDPEYTTGTRFILQFPTAHARES